MLRCRCTLCNIVAFAMLALVMGCSTKVTTSDGRPMPPEPNSAPKTPVDADANAMALLVALKPTDSDGNSYPDQIAVQAFLYSRPHPTSIHEPGAFVFELFAAGASVHNSTPIASWRFEGQRVDDARIHSRLFSRGYTFRLSLLETGGDVLPSMTSNLIGRFEPADGRAAVRADGVRIIQIGRGSTAAVLRR